MVQTLGMTSCNVYQRNSHISLISSCICPFSFSPTKISVTDFSASIGAWVFKLCIHLEVGQVYCVTENQIADVYFSFFFKFYFFHLSLLCNSFEYLPSKISQQLLDLGLSNLVQRLGMTSCAMYQMISHIFHISPFIFPFFFLSNKMFHHISSAFTSARVFKFCIQDKDDQMYY